MAAKLLQLFGALAIGLGLVIVWAAHEAAGPGGTPAILVLLAGAGGPILIGALLVALGQAVQLLDRIARQTQRQADLFERWVNRQPSA